MLGSTGMSEIDSAIYELKQEFPNLGSQAKITSPSTETYNCIACAAGDTSRWWWPDYLGVAYWPPRCRRAVTLPAFQLAFESIGFRLCSGGEYQEGYDKIAIFHKNSVPTHAARQIDFDVWSSKLGQWFDISHSISCLCGFGGQSYGEIAYFMRRQRA